MILDGHVKISWRHVHMPAADGISVLGLDHGQQRRAAKQLVQLALEGGAAVKHDTHRGGQPGGQPPQDADQRFDATCRSAKEEEIADGMILIDHGAPPALRGCSTSGRSLSMSARRRIDCSRARSARARKPSAPNFSVRPFRFRSDSKAISSSKAKTALHSTVSSWLSFVASSSESA